MDRAQIVRKVSGYAAGYTGTLATYYVSDLFEFC